jgi:hypothetical protein
MGYIQNLLLQSFLLWHNQSFLKPLGPFRTLIDKSDLQVTFLHSSLDMTHTFIILLSSYYLIPQGRREGDVEQ